MCILCQGAANKQPSKNLPPKHGLQSLGKVPTARRAPVNLPSEKSEKGGNDPSVVLVPSGGGWANKDGDKEPVERSAGGAGPPPGPPGGGAAAAGEQGQTKAQPSADVAGSGVSPPSGSAASGAKLWSSVTGSGPGSGQEVRQKNFLHQKSPLFGQEFPSLPGDAPAGSQTARDSMIDSPDLASPHSQDPAYGPGPNLRPQTFGGWSQGGAGRPGGLQTEAEGGEHHLPPQPHKPQPPPPASKSPGTTQYKSIMPPFMDAMELPAGQPQQFNKRSGGRGGGVGPRHHRDSRSRHQQPPSSDFTAHSIIDTEKLKRMDDLDNGNDWTYEDDDFDYNKKLESDEEEASEPVQSSNPSDPDWADQVQSSHQTKSPHQHYNYYDEFKSKPAVGFDDEERRRNKKSEEVMKNIERARQRREEEENRYRRQGGPGQEGEAGHYNRDNSYRYRDGRQRPGYEGERFERQDRYYENYREAEGGGGGYKRKEELHHHLRRDERYQRHDSEVSATESLEQERRLQQNMIGSASPEWSGERNTRRIQDWVQDVEEGDERDQREEGRDHDRPSRPNSRDSRVSKDSRGSKGKSESQRVQLISDRPPSGSRASRDREIVFGGKKEEKVGKFYSGDNDKKAKPPKQSPIQDIRGYFRDDVVDQDKKQFRHAPGPITKEKLESFEMKESMTQLKKRDTKVEEKKEEKPIEKIEPTNVLSSLLDSDLLENISEDDDILDNDEEEKEVTVTGTRGRGRGRGRGDKFVGHGRGKGDRQERGGRASRGGRADNKRGGGGGSQNKWAEGEEVQENDEEKKSRKPESLMSGQQQGGSGFMPRGQPSRRGRGEGRVKQGSVLGRGKVTGDFGGNEEIGDWSEQGDKLVGGGRGKQQQRLPRGKKEGGRPGSGGGEEVEEWETASETSLEEREKRRGKVESRGRGGRGGGRGGVGSGPGWEKGRKGPPGGSGNGGSGSLPGAGGPASLGPADSQDGPDQTTKRAPGIENFDLNDYAGVHVVDDTHWTDSVDADTEQSGEAEGFLQVVNKKARGGLSSLPVGQRDGMRERRGQDPRMMNDKKISKNAYDRRQNKLPPRLAKQREVAKAQARSGPGQQSPSPGTENGWPEGDKMGVFNIDTGTGAWEKPSDANIGHPGPAPENGSIQQTIIFENTAYKGGKSEKMDKAGPIQLPLSFSKQDPDNGDLKLDFTFGGEENCLKPGSGQTPLSTIPKSLSSVGLPASPSTDDLQTKLANTKKLWDAPGMPVVPENSNAGSWNESDLYGENNPDPSADKTADREAVPGSSPHSGVSNIAKVKPQQQLNMEGERAGGSGGLQYNRMAVPSPPGNHSLPPLQTPLQPWAFLSDASRTSPMYNPYSPLNQSILMPGVTGHNLNTDIFNSNNGGYRGVQGVPNFPGSGVGHTTTNNVLMSQASLINSQVKLGTGIGPIGTKAGAGGPGPSSPYLANLPNTNSNIFIQYDNSGNPLNYMPGSAPPGRGNPPSQTAFYQSLAAANRQQHQQAAAFSALQAANALSHQVRASAVAGMPFQKMDQAKSPVSHHDSSGYTAVPPYNGRATNPPAGPPSPKTKLKIAQQQEQAKMNAGMNSLNINNLNALAQMQRTMNLGHFNNVSGLLQQPTVAGQYNPSPIARPQVSERSGEESSVKIFLGESLPDRSDGRDRTELGSALQTNESIFQSGRSVPLNPLPTSLSRSSCFRRRRSQVRGERGEPGS